MSLFTLNSAQFLSKLSVVPDIYNISDIPSTRQNSTSGFKFLHTKKIVCIVHSNVKLEICIKTQKFHEISCPSLFLPLFVLLSIYVILFLDRHSFSLRSSLPVPLGNIM